MADSYVNIYINYVSKYGNFTNKLLIDSGLSITEFYIPEISLPGLIFEGWYTSETFEEDTKVELGMVIDTEITFYAKWSSTDILVNAKYIYDIANAIRNTLSLNKSETFALGDFVVNIEKRRGESDWSSDTPI